MDFIVFKEELERKFPRLSFRCFVSVGGGDVSSVIYVYDGYYCILSLTRDSGDATVVFLGDFRGNLLDPRRSKHFQRSAYFREDEVEDLTVRLLEEYLTERKKEHPQA